MTSFLEYITKNNHIVLCSYCLSEFYDVVNCKFPNKQREIEIFLQKLPFSLVHTPEIDIIEMDINIRDKADYPILMSAVLADVDILISGDKDFEDVSIDRPEILTPAEYYNTYIKFSEMF
jgi:predicted nucleic acid-binding protein